MNITIFSWRDIKHPLAGGAEQSLWEHAKYWADKGAKVSWFASSFPEAKESEVLDTIHVIRRGSHFTVHLHALIAYLKGELPQAHVVIDSFHFLPYFTPLYRRNAVIIALLNEVAGTVWFQNIGFPLNYIGYILEPFFFLFYKKVQFIVGSESARHDLKKVGIRSEQIAVIHHGVTISYDFSNLKKEKDPTVLFLSRISKDKGIEDALASFSILMKKNQSLQFWIGGKPENPEYYNEVLKVAEKRGITKSTTFYGFVSEEEKFRLFAKAWILVHPSTREGWGLNIIEANSQGTPAVGYRVSGLIDSIQDKKTGLLADNNNPQGLADKVQLLLDQESMRAKMSEEALKWSTNFSWSKAGALSWEVINKMYKRS